MTHYDRILSATSQGWQGWHQLGLICNWPQARVRDLEKRGVVFERRRVARKVNGRPKQIVQLRLMAISSTRGGRT